MLRLPIFEHHSPASVDDALSLMGGLHAQGREVRLIAGGTDLVPNMKHEIETPDDVVSLRNAGLAGVRREGDVIILGAMTSVRS